MHYQGNIFRPPSEASSILLQVTTGCSHNRCTFCGMYKGSRFSIKNEAVVMADIAFAARHCRHQNRLFLCDGDALILPQPRLTAILTAIREQLPWVGRVGTYANSKSIRRKSGAELAALRDLGLGIVYLGVESGDDVTLERIRKGGDSARMIETGRKVRAAGITLSVTVLLGIAAPERSLIHARETARVLSAIDPDYIGALSVIPTPGTPLHRELSEAGRPPAGVRQLLEELRVMVAGTELTDGYFHANHASNYLPIKARLPGDKQAALQLIDRALGGEISLTPEWRRAL